MLYTVAALSAVLSAQRVNSAAYSSHSVFDLPRDLFGDRICGFLEFNEIGDLRLSGSWMNDIIQDTYIPQVFDDDTKAEDVREFVVMASFSSLKFTVFYKGHSFKVQGYSPVRSSGFTGQFSVTKEVSAGFAAYLHNSCLPSNRGWMIVDSFGIPPMLANIETAQTLQLDCEEAFFVGECTLAMRRKDDEKYELYEFDNGMIGDKHHFDGFTLGSIAKGTKMTPIIDENGQSTNNQPWNRIVFPIGDPPQRSLVIDLDNCNHHCKETHIKWNNHDIGQKTIQWEREQL